MLICWCLLVLAVLAVLLLVIGSRAVVAVGAADGAVYLWDFSAINDLAASETTGGEVW
jgi:hypothetical protein